MRQRLLMLAWCAPIVLAGCDAVPSATPRIAAVVTMRDTSVAAYFGAPTSRLDSLMLDWFAGELRSMHEPPLRGATLPQGTSVLRFTWLASFSDRVSVRATRSAAGCQIATTVHTPTQWVESPDTSDHRLEQVPGHLVRRDSTPEAMSTCATLTSLIDRLPLHPSGPFSRGGGPDGAEWIFERTDQRGHAAMVQWSPNCVDCAVTITGKAFLTAAHAMPTGPLGLY